MKVTLTSTTKIVTLNGIETRVWEGETSEGISCHAYIVRIAVKKDLDASAFERDLQECATPSMELTTIPAHMIL